MTPLRERLDQIANSVTGGDLIDGASLYRQSMARERHRHALWGSVAAAAIVASVAIVASIVGTGGNPRIAPVSPPPLVEPSESSAVERTCPVGEERAVFRNAGMKSVLLGCARMQDGRKVELLSDGGGLCLQIVGIDNRVRECGNAPSEQEPPKTEAVAAQAIAQRNNSAPLEVYGATSADVTKVELRYTREGSSHRARAELIRVTNGEALEKAGIAQPFGYFLSELPPDASNIIAIGLNSEGQRIGGDDFEPFLPDQPRGFFVSGPSR